MTASERDPQALTVDLAGWLAEHPQEFSGGPFIIGCGCGESFPTDAAHRAHVAAVLADRLSARPAATIDRPCPEYGWDHPTHGWRNPGDARVSNCPGYPPQATSKNRITAADVDEAMREFAFLVDEAPATTTVTAVQSLTERVRALLKDVQEVVDKGGTDLDAREVVTRLVAVLLPNALDRLTVAASDLSVSVAVDTVLDHEETGPAEC